MTLSNTLWYSRTRQHCSIPFAAIAFKTDRPFLHFSQAWELIWMKNSEIQGDPGAWSAKKSPPPPQNIKICGIWGYPEIIKLTLLSAPPPTGPTSMTTRWKPPHFNTSNDWSLPQAPSNSRAHSPLQFNWYSFPLLSGLFHHIEEYVTVLGCTAA